MHNYRVESCASLTARQALAAILPPKKAEMEPKPAVVDEVPFEASDIVDVRETPFPAGSNFFDHASGFQFGEGDEEDEDTNSQSRRLAGVRAPTQNTVRAPRPRPSGVRAPRRRSDLR